MSYENAPATKLLATHCAACSRPLVDAISVEVGVGPECRKKYGLPDTLDEATRAEANKIVYQIAMEQDSFEALLGAMKLKVLGCHKMADRVIERLATVKISEADGKVYVDSPYNEAALPAWRRVPGRSMTKDANGKWTTPSFPASSKRAILDVLNTYYAGALAVGPKGPFVVGKAAA